MPRQGYQQGRFFLPVLECSRCNELFYSAHGSTELACDNCGGHVWRVFEDEVSFARVVGLPREWGLGDHGAIVYTEADEAAGFCAEYLRDGLRRGEFTKMAVPADLRTAIEVRLEPGEVSAIDAGEPSACYFEFEPRAVAERFAEIVRTADRPVRLLSGPDTASVEGVTAEEWRRYEQICHELVLELGAIALCVFDGRSLPVAFSPVAIEAHPLISRGGGELKRNTDFSYVPAGV